MSGPGATVFSVLSPILTASRQYEPAVTRRKLVAGMSAATATLIALFRTRITGEGCHIEASAYEGDGDSACKRARELRLRPSAAIALPVGSPRKLRQGASFPRSAASCPANDGYVAISPREDAQWQRWIELMDNPQWACEERFLTRDGRESNFTELWDLVGEWTRPPLQALHRANGTGEAHTMLSGQTTFTTFSTTRT